MSMLILGMICSFFSVNKICAKMINLQSQLTVTTKKKTIDIKITILNTGSAAAYDIITRIHFLDILKESKIIHHLRPNLAETITLEFDLPKDIKGHFPLLAEIQFHDMNLFPFYSLRCTVINIKSQEQESRLAVQVPDLKLSAQNTINVHVENMDFVDRNIFVQMIVSRAFTCEKNKHFIFLQKGLSADIEYCILKKDALSATTHTGYVLLTFKDNTVSYAEVKPFNIYIKPVDKLFIFEKSFAAKTCIVFGLIWILFLTYVSFRKKTDF